MPMLEKWPSLPEIGVLERRMRRLFEDVGMTPTVSPAADVYETTDEIVVELEVPGYDDEELTVTVSDHTLSVVGDRTREATKKEKALRVRERLESHFERSFQLPVSAQTDHVQAEYAKGVLTMHVPKQAGSTPRPVRIEKK